MKKSKKMIVIIGIALVFVSLIGVFIYDRYVTSSNKSEKVLRFYSWENGKPKEHGYNCKTNSCSSQKIENSSLINGEYVENDYYMLSDGKTYLYNPITNEKLEIEITNGHINQIFYNEHGEKIALSIKDGNFSFEREYLYLIENKKIYLKGNSNASIDFMMYEYFDGDTIKHKYINIDLIVSEKMDGHFEIIDYKNNKVVFDTKMFIVSNENDYFNVSLNPIKLSDNKYYYDLYYESSNEKSYILNDKFEKIISHEPENLGGQFYSGRQYSIYANKIYVVNEKSNSFSVYDLNGKLITKSKKYNYIYCVDKGYYLVSFDKDDNYSIIDSNEKLIATLDIPHREGQEISLNDNVITVSTYDMFCNSTYKYDLKTNKFIEKNDRCDDME